MTGEASGFGRGVRKRTVGPAVAYNRAYWEEELHVHAHKLKVTIPKNHRLKLAVDLPADFPAGPAEVIVLGTTSQPTDETDAERLQQQLAVLDEIRSTALTSEEEEVLDGFESFRREHPFRLASLDED